MKHPVTRSHRRANRARIINNRSKKIIWVIHSLEWIVNDNKINNIERQRRLGEVFGKINKTPVPCSCAMCGNPRKWKFDDPLTLHEHRAFLDMKDGVEEWYTEEH